MGLIANVSADSIQPIGYDESITNVDSEAVYEYYVRSTISIWEGVEGQARRALEASMENATYDEVLSQCLGRIVTGVSGSFKSTPGALPALDSMSVSTLMESTDGPAMSPTPRSTLEINNGKKYCDAARSIHSMNVATLFIVCYYSCVSIMAAQCSTVRCCFTAE